MSRASIPQFLVLALVLVLGVVWVERSSAQARATRYIGWPPLPENIVHLRGTSIGLDDGDTFVIYTVPKDKWLVITDARVGGYGEYDTSTGLGAYPYNLFFSLEKNTSTGTITFIDGAQPTPSSPNNGLYVPLYIGALDAMMYADRNRDRDGSSAFTSVTGLPVDPSAVLRVRYKNTADIKGDSAQAFAQWNIVGYLADR